MHAHSLIYERFMGYLTHLTLSGQGRCNCIIFPSLAFVCLSILGPIPCEFKVSCTNNINFKCLLMNFLITYVVYHNFNILFEKDKKNMTYLQTLNLVSFDYDNLVLLLVYDEKMTLLI